MFSDMLMQGLAVYQENPSVFFALISTLLILIFALLMGNRVQKDEFRIVIIIVPIALGVYLASLNAEDLLERDFFQNLSTEFIGGLLALILFADWVTSQDYTFPLVVIIIFLIAGFFLWQASVTSDGFYVNFSSELLGALITTTVVRRNWLWSSRVTETPHDRHERFKIKRRELERDTAKQFADLQIIIYGRSSVEMDKKVSAIGEFVDIAHVENDIKPRNQSQQRILYATLRTISSVKLDASQFMILLDGHIEAIKKVLVRFRQSFELISTHEHIEMLSDERATVRLDVKTPSMSFDEELFMFCEGMIEHWEEVADEQSNESSDYIKGYRSALEYISSDLLATIQK